MGFITMNNHHLGEYMFCFFQPPNQQIQVYKCRQAYHTWSLWDHDGYRKHIELTWFGKQTAKLEHHPEMKSGTSDTNKQTFKTLGVSSPYFFSFSEAKLMKRKQIQDWIFWGVCDWVVATQIFLEFSPLLYLGFHDPI